MKMIDVSKVRVFRGSLFVLLMLCLLYTSDAADEL